MKHMLAGLTNTGLLKTESASVTPGVLKPARVFLLAFYPPVLADLVTRAFCFPSSKQRKALDQLR